MSPPLGRYWVVAEFPGESTLMEAAKTLVGEGHRNVDMHSPHPIHGSAEVLDLRPSRVRWVGLLGGVGGAILGFAICWWTNGIDFPINVGGRPLNSAPASIPVTFEMGVLIASLSILFSLFAIIGLPRLYHPVFEAPGFERVSVDAYWLSFSLRTTEEVARTALERVNQLGASHASLVKDPQLERAR